MAFWNKFPYTDFHELNLSWFLSEFIKFKEEVKNFYINFGETIVEEVNNWLDDHPEATTTVEVGSITENKINADFLKKIKNDYVTPQIYGAAGNGVTFDDDALKNALNDGRPIFLPEGTYLINSFINVPSNRIIFGSGEKTVIKINRDGSNKPLGLCFGEYGVGGYATDYNGVHDVVIKDLTYDINDSDNTTGGNIGLSHCSNITIENINFINGYNDHYLDVAGSKNVVIKNCSFDGANYTIYEREAINIDWSWQTGFPHFGQWDNTNCYNIKINGCYFNAFTTAFCIGSHATPTGATKHYNISVDGNNFESCDKILNTLNYSGIAFINNNITDTGKQNTFPIYFYNSSDINIAENIVSLSSYYLVNIVSETKGENNNAIISGNNIIDCSNSVFRSNKFEDITISNNVYINSGFPFEGVDSSNINFINNNTSRNPLLSGCDNITCISNNEISQTFQMVQGDTGQLNELLLSSKLILIEATRYGHVGSSLFSMSRILNNSVALYKASPGGSDIIINVNSSGLVTLNTGHESVQSYITFRKIM